MYHPFFSYGLIAGSVWAIHGAGVGGTLAAEQAPSICVVTTTLPRRLQNVEVRYGPQQADTVVVATGRRFSQQYPLTSPPYVAAAQFYVDNDPVTFQQRRWVKYGLPRVIESVSLQYRGDYRGHPVFVATGESGTPDVLYFPVRQGCVFQPYQYEVKVGGVRG